MELLVRKVFSFTLGSAFLVAVEDLCPAIPEGQLRLDIGSVDERERNVLFITEIERGIGHIENFYEEFIKNPNKFYHLVRRNLDRSILEKTDEQLQSFMNLVNNEEEEDIAQIINTLRDRLNHADNYRNRGELDKKLEQIGFQNNHEFKHALTTRFFRTNSNADLDNVLKSMYFKWKDFEEKLDIEIDLRVIAFILSNRNENKIEEVLSEVDTPTDRNMIIAWRMGVIYGLLWGRGRIIRNNHLNVYNPYLQDLELQNKALERILFSNFLNTYFNRISIEERILFT